ncbi:MAG: glycosyltransferase [Nitrosopumilaceae archaeon]|nr:glycosyltransferase family 2 protein [Nitrosopumilaceae archaeon]NIX62877.1 glycosyltransferase [Nitrosopumilaceae archaeon]
MSSQIKPVILSVIIPVRNTPNLLQKCLEKINSSHYHNYEVIVVDDASTDETPEIAAKMGAKVLRLSENVGPAQARNQGVEIAAGTYIFFIDADVLVHSDTLDKVVQTFEQNPEVDAVFGSYDTKPSALNIMSQYKNLFHHFVHQESREEATTFWSGCGAIKKAVFQKLGGFDTYYQRPCIEDIELGVRLHKAGYKILLKKDIQVRHLKQWTFWGMLKADIQDRAIPWTELIMRENELPNDLNLTLRQRLSALFSLGIIVALIIESLTLGMLFFLPVVLFMLFLFLDYWSIERRIPTMVRLGSILGGLLGIVATVYYQKIWLIIALLLGCCIVLLNYRFYSFFALQKYLLFAIMIIPLHIFYYIYSSISFGLGIVLYFWKVKIRKVFKPSSI